MRHIKTLQSYKLLMQNDPENNRQLLYNMRGIRTVEYLKKKLPGRANVLCVV